jgi:hypothetical protein
MHVRWACFPTLVDWTGVDRRIRADHRIYILGLILPNIAIASALLPCANFLRTE